MKCDVKGVHTIPCFRDLPVQRRLSHSVCNHPPIKTAQTFTLQQCKYRHKGKGKGNVDLYSAFSRTPLTRSNIEHTMLPANNTISAFTRKRSPGGATTYIRIANAWVQLTTHLSTPREQMVELAMLADIQTDGLPRGGHPSTTRHRAGQGKFAGHRPTF